MTILEKRKMLGLVELQDVRCFEENPNEEAWTNHDRHFFIITDSARPVYCRYGNEVTITPLLCTVVALTGQLVRDGNQKLRTVHAGDRVFVFYLPFPFIFCAVSSANVPESIILKELQILESVMYSVLSPNILPQVKKRPNFDIKRQSLTMERMFTASLDIMDHAHWFIMRNYVPMAGRTGNKEAFASIVHEHRDKSVLAVVIFYYGDVVLTVEDAGFHLSADDILILACNTYSSISTFDSQWVPIWLPGYADMVHMLTADIGMFEFKMILISNQICYTESVARMVTQISAKMQNENLRKLITPVGKFPRDEVIHWMVSDKALGQVYCPPMDVSPVSDMIYSNYAWTYEFLMSDQKPVQNEFFLALEDVTIFGRHTNQSTLMAAADVGITPAQAQELLASLTKFVEEKRSIIFDQKPMRWE